MKRSDGKKIVADDKAEVRVPKGTERQQPPVEAKTSKATTHAADKYLEVNKSGAEVVDDACVAGKAEVGTASIVSEKGRQCERGYDTCD